ncbi:monosaccharide ABC transporter substrate-binding protein (CUT2 family) [Mobilisporobacter senegalensis]|uniref:Monosaccharide ABC transporter substrate-binding protein (CUT2 family) n=1 Tax=Mobilisporobacter senegalensis TaxID=1329262 RepID=A0A3N1XI49_9FIRM|nr:ABC transporter substrate-binding protein [Mobilisporobacter senegalensis]ROR26383.1 monosaccharide ABC transporter substrate-binding protein (CUT2 family) [Mobilisporobacter senegalensis]
MKLKKVVAMGIATVLVAGMMLTGCGKKEEVTPENTENTGTETTTETDTGNSENLTVEIIAKGFQHDFWQAVLKGTEKAAEEFGVTTNFVGPANESAIAEQVEQLNNAINKGPSAIALAALDTSAAVDAISNAQSKGIPIVGFDSGVPGAPEGSVVANAATDNYKAGELAAEKMYEAIKDKVTDPAETVRIGVVAQEANSDSITKRTAGFVEKMSSLIGEDKSTVEGHDKYNRKVDGAKVVIEVRIPSEVSDNAGKTEALTLLNKADLVGIYGSNEFASKCIINANEGMNKLGTDKVIAIGFDSGALQIDAIKSGVFYGSITQDPISIGYNAVKLAVAAAKGEAVTDVDTGCQFYNAENIENEDIAPLLYE